METAVIFEKLTTVFRDIFEDEAIEVNPQLSANDVEYWDSLSHVRLILTVEREFDVSFSTAELSQFDNVGQLADMIKEKLTA